MRRFTAVLATFCLTLLLNAPGPVGAQDEEATAAPKLAITAVTVEPEKPGPDTLCRLRVKIKNEGDEVASQLGFDVKLNGQDLTVYDNQLFMFPVPAGGEGEIQLYNFWTTETSRPEMPKGGKYEVEVSLREAQWMSITMEEEDGEEIEVWRPLGAIESLPVSSTVTLETSKVKPTG